MTRFLLILTILFAVGAACLWCVGDRDRPGFCIEPAIYSPDPSLVEGTETTTMLKAINRSGHTVRIVSIANRCGDNCCFGSKQATPFDIPPYSEQPLEAYLAIGHAGPYSTDIHVFVDDGGLRDIVVRLQGVAMPKGKAK
jgi:hypothetical protein